MLFLHPSVCYKGVLEVCHVTNAKGLHNQRVYQSQGLTNHDLVAHLWGNIDQYAKTVCGALQARWSTSVKVWDGS